MQMRAIVFLLISVGLFGCADDETLVNPAQVTPQISPKPLPACGEKVQFEIQSKDHPEALKRVVRVGRRSGKYSKEYIARQARPPVEYERGETYYVQGETTWLDKSVYYMPEKIIFVPTCEQREEYQKANPAYEEPIILIP